MNDKLIFKWWLWLVIALSICIIPLFVNWLIGLRNPLEDYLPVSSSEWLTFFGNYSGSVVAGLITLLVLYKTLRQNRYHHEQLMKIQINNMNYSHMMNRYDRTYSLLIKMLNRMEPISVIDKLEPLCDIHKKIPIGEYSRYSAAIHCDAHEIMVHFGNEVNEYHSRYYEAHGECMNLHFEFIKVLLALRKLLDHERQDERQDRFKQMLDEWLHQEIITEELYDECISNLLSTSGMELAINSIIFYTRNQFYDNCISPFSRLQIITEELLENEMSNIKSVIGS